MNEQQLNNEVRRIIQGSDCESCYEYSQSEVEYILDKLMSQTSKTYDYSLKNTLGWVMQALTMKHSDQKSTALIKEYLYTAVLYIKTHCTKMVLDSAHWCTLTDENSFYRALAQQKDLTWILNILNSFEPQEIIVLYIRTHLAITDKNKSLQNRLKIIQTYNLFVQAFNSNA